jgi:hypothetical protein
MSKAESVANATAALSKAQAESPSDQGAIDSATAALAAANALPNDDSSPFAELVYSDIEHEAMLTHLDHMHHESRGQTIARLEAALATAKAAVGDFLSPLATRTETVTREVTIDPNPVTPALTPAEQADVARQAPTTAEEDAAIRARIDAANAANKAAADARAAGVPEPPTAG